VNVDAGAFLDDRRHTGSARIVVSNLAVANLDGVHGRLLASDSPLPL